MSVKRATCLKTHFCSEELCNVTTARGAAYLNYGCNLTENVQRPTVQISVYYRNNNLYQIFPIEGLENICDYVKFRDIRTPILFHINLQGLLNGTSNNVLRCTFEAGQYYYVRNLLVYDKVLPLYGLAFPLGDYKVNLLFSSENTGNFINITAFFQIVSKANRKPRIAANKSHRNGAPFIKV